MYFEQPHIFSIYNLPRIKLLFLEVFNIFYIGTEKKLCYKVLILSSSLNYCQKQVNQVKQVFTLTHDEDGCHIGLQHCSGCNSEQTIGKASIAIFTKGSVASILLATSAFDT